MNYRAVFPIMDYPDIRIEVTSRAADAGSGVYGTLKLARAHLEMWIDREIENLREAKRHWCSLPERKLPIDPWNIPAAAEPTTQEPPATGEQVLSSAPAAGEMPDIPENLRRVPR